jgi:hypothetical protein
VVVIRLEREGPNIAEGIHAEVTRTIATIPDRPMLLPADGKIITYRKIIGFYTLTCQALPV